MTTSVPPLTPKHLGQWLAEPHPSIIEAGQRSRARLLSSLLLGIIVVTALFTVWYIFELQQRSLLWTDPFLMLLLAGLVLLSVTYRLSRTRHYRWAAALFITFVILMVLADVITIPESALDIAYLILALLMSSLFFSPRATFLLLVACVLAILPAPLLSSSLSWQNIENAELFLVVVGLFIIAVATLRQHDQARLEQQARELAESNEQQAAVLRAAPVVLYRALASGDFPATWYSENVERITGFPGERFLADPTFWVSRLHPDDRQRVLHEFNNLQERVTTCEYRWQCADDSYHWFLDQVISLRNSGGNVTEFMGSWFDITERKRAEIALHESEAELRALFAAMDDVVIVHDRQGYYLKIAPTDASLLYKPPADLMGKTLHEVLPASQATLLLETIQRVLDTHQTITVDYSLTIGEREIWFAATLSPLKDDTVILVAHDITEHKQAEEALARSEKEFRNLVENALVGIYRTAAKGEILYVNDALARMLDFDSPQDMMREGVIVRYKNPAARVALLADLQKNGIVHNCDLEVLTKSGETRNILLSAALEQDILTGMIIDITERKQAEEQLRVLFSLSTRLRQAATANEMYPIILSEACQILKADTGMVVLLDPNNNRFTIAFADRYMASNIGCSFELEQGISGIVLRTHQPYITPDYANDPHRLTTLQNGEEIGPAVSVPLQSEVELVGALMLGRQRSEDAPPFSPSEVRLLAAVGEMVGNALRRVRLFDDAERRLSRAQALRAIDVAITASTNLQLTLKAALDQTVAELSVDAASVLLLNPSTHTLKYIAGNGFRSNAYSRTQVRLGDGQAGKAALERQIVAHPDFTVKQPIFAMPELMAGESFAAYYAVPLIAKGSVKGVLEIFHRAPLHPDDEWLNFLEALGGQIAIAIDDALMFEGLQRSNTELITAYDATIEGWSRALDLRDKETEGHTQRVTEMTMRLAHAMDLSNEELMHIHRGALLHDMGKLGVPDAILLKPGKLTDEEWAVMRRHPQFAYDMLAPIPFLKKALDIPYCHHEKWDGTGYPRGLKGEQIPLAARLFAIVDVWDALRSDRPYRQGWSEDKVRDYIRANSGTHFDPKVVEAFMSMLDDGSEIV